MPQREISNYHQAFYLVAQGCMIEEVTIYPDRLDLAWTMKLSGADIENLDRMFEEGTATVNMKGYMLAEKHVQQKVREAQKKWLSDYKTGKRGKITYEM